MEDSDLYIDTITADLVALLVSVFSDPKIAPTFILVGHSMGGAACVRACPVLQEKRYSVSGVAVLDVVEGAERFARESTIPTGYPHTCIIDDVVVGSALDALPIMMSLLDSRPDGFGSVEEAVQWQ
jgi:protein phosphatase methylesterase 1